MPSRMLPDAAAHLLHEVLVHQGALGVAAVAVSLMLQGSRCRHLLRLRSRSLKSSLRRLDARHNAGHVHGDDVHDFALDPIQRLAELLQLRRILRVPARLQQLASARHHERRSARSPGVPGGGAAADVSHVHLVGQGTGQQGGRAIILRQDGHQRNHVALGGVRVSGQLVEEELVQGCQFEASWGGRHDDLAGRWQAVRCVDAVGKLRFDGGQDVVRLLPHVTPQHGEVEAAAVVGDQDDRATTAMLCHGGPHGGDHLREAGHPLEVGVEDFVDVTRIRRHGHRGLEEGRKHGRAGLGLDIHPADAQRHNLG